MSLQVTEKFRYLFQGIRANASSTGAILLDDVTLTESACPSGVWQIQNFTGLLATALPGTPVKSDCFSSSEGYSFGVTVYPNGRESANQDYVGLTIHLCSGEDDAVMEWPAKNRQVTIVAMDQDPDVKLRMSSTRSFTTGRPLSLGFRKRKVQLLAGITHCSLRSYMQGNERNEQSFGLYLQRSVMFS